MVFAAMLIGVSATAARADQQADVIVASGILDGRFLASSLFHIDEFWIRVTAKTEFNRWLSEGLKHRVVVLLTTTPERFGDDKNMRILTGTLLHQTAPKMTEIDVNVVGRLPEGDSLLVHELFLKDELSGSIGAVTFETADTAVASAFGKYDGKKISVVIRIELPEQTR